MNSPPGPRPTLRARIAPAGLRAWTGARPHRTGRRGGIRALASRAIGAELLCRLLEEGPQPFAAIDLERRIIWSNRAFSELVGFDREELLGMSILDLTAPNRWRSRGVTRTTS